MRFRASYLSTLRINLSFGAQQFMQDGVQWQRFHTLPHLETSTELWLV